MRLKIVENWRKGWRWFSVWAFALIVFFATTPLPPEVVAILPKPLADNLITLVAVCGLILRFIQQSDPANIKYRYGGGQGKTDKAKNLDNNLNNEQTTQSFSKSETGDGIGQAQNTSQSQALNALAMSGSLNEMQANQDHKTCGSYGVTDGYGTHEHRPHNDYGSSYGSCGGYDGGSSSGGSYD